MIVTTHYADFVLLFSRYADSAKAYWTGFFTSRPAFKRYVRMLSGYYLVRSLQISSFLSIPYICCLYSAYF